MRVFNLILTLLKAAFYLGCCAIIAGLAPSVAQAYAGQLALPMGAASMQLRAIDPLSEEIMPGRASMAPALQGATTTFFPERVGGALEAPRLDVFTTSVVRNVAAKRTMLLWFSYPASVRGRVFGGGGIDSPTMTGGW